MTDGVTHTESPVFDKNGKYLYFVWSPNAGTSDYGWGVLNGMMTRPLVQRNLSLFILQKDQPSPLLPNGRPNPDADVKTPNQKTVIDFEDIRQRVINLPSRSRDYARIATGKAGEVFPFVIEWGTSPSFLSNPSQTLYRYDLSKNPKFEKIAENVSDFDLSPNGKQLLYLTRRDTFLVSAENPIKKGDGKLDFKNLKVKVHPKEEWRQMYRESWRLMRDWFYDKNHHGQNLAELEKHFAEYLPNVNRRRDLNALFLEMLSHISVSHLGVRGGDQTLSRQAARIGMLGADYEIDSNRYRFKKVLRTSHFDDPSGNASAPLDQPGLNVRKGEYLLAVNGKNIDASKNVYSYFAGTARRPTKITVGPNPDGTNARTMTVFPGFGENGLRRANWAEKNRKIVEEKSGGKLGYIYVGNYGPGIIDFIRGSNRL